MQPRSVLSICAFLVAMAFAFSPWQSATLHAQTGTPEPAPFTLTPASGGEERPASEIFAEISPAIAFIETPAGTGSGALIEGDYLLTNAHVVWPFESVRVVFPDGSEYPDAPVLAWDTVADLALVGPIDTDIEPIPLVDEPELEIGSAVYLIGYPAEVEEFPQPAITSGILSRIRTWDAIDYSFYQADATTTGGPMMSG